MEKVLLEFGGVEISPVGGDEEEKPMSDPYVRAGLKLIGDMQDAAGPGVFVEGVPYESGPGPLSGGRPSRLRSVGELVACFTEYNRNGIAFNFALNGGMFLSSNDVVGLVNSFSSELRRVLEVLNRSGEEHGVQNYVTIYRDELLDVVRGAYPNLKTVASCIKFTVNGVEEAMRLYEEALGKYDYVVPLPQHSKAEYWDPFAKDIRRLILFPHLACSEQNLDVCKSHYESLERTGEWKGKCAALDDSLLHRLEEDLLPFIAMGARGFKFPRYDNGARIFGSEFAKLLGIVLRRLAEVSEEGGVAQA